MASLVLLQQRPCHWSFSLLDRSQTGRRDGGIRSWELLLSRLKKGWKHYPTAQDAHSCSTVHSSLLRHHLKCFLGSQEDSTTIAKVKAAFPENAIGNVVFYSSYNDTSPDGPPGTYTLSYLCQYAYNPVIQLNPGITANPYNDAAAADARTNAVIPYWMNGMFGGKGEIPQGQTELFELHIRL